MCIFRSTKAKQQASHCAVCLCVSTKAEQQASNREAPPEHVEVERQKPERGLTSKVRGWLEAGEARCKPVPLDRSVRGHGIHEMLQLSLILPVREPRDFLKHNALTNWHLGLGNAIRYRAKLRPRLCEDHFCVV